MSQEETLDALVSFATDQGRVCPNPESWNRIYTELLQRTGSEFGEFRGVPLILAGWWASSEREKQVRLREQIEYAGQNGLLAWIDSQLRGLSQADWCHEGAAGGSVDYFTPGMRWMGRAPSARPSESDIRGAIERLKQGWPLIAGASISSRTEPLRLTGTKRRRLVCSVSRSAENFAPPWGEWQAITANRTAFSRLRRAVNEAMAPLEVDHVDFEVERLDRRD